MTRLAAAVLLIAVATAGCGRSDATQSPVDTIPLATQPPVGTVTPEVCMAALLEGTLALDPDTGLGVAQEGRVVPVRWPNGWMALDTVPVELTNDHGEHIASVGGHVAIGGGFGGGGLGREGVREACPYDIKVVP